MFKILNIFVTRGSCWKIAMPWDTAFKANLIKAIERSPHRSHRAIAKAANISNGQISGMINDPKRHGPGLYVVADLCRALETDPNKLLGFQSDGRPDHSAMISAWVDRKLLADLRWAEDYFDVYTIPQPTDKRLQILHLGKRSLASSATGITSRRFFQLTMNEFSDRSARAAIISDYASMADRDIATSIQTLNVPAIAHLKKAVTLRYERLLLRSTDPDGRQVVVNFSTQI